MKTILAVLCGAALTWAVPAEADVRSYCQAYARNQADGHLSGSSVLGSQPKIAAAERDKRKILALADCLALYAPKPIVEPVSAEPETLMAKPIATPRIKPKSIVQAKQKTAVTRVAKIEAATVTTAPAQKKKPVSGTTSLIAGSPAWKKYCAAKYASYNPATDTYTARSGEQRACRVTKKQEPARSTKTQLPAPAAASKLPTRAATSQPLSAAPAEKSRWDSFNSPKLPVGR